MTLLTFAAAAALSFGTLHQEKAAGEDAPPVSAAIARGLERLLEMQQGTGGREWPYEGVYKVEEDGQPVIPIGYRVGGTSIAAAALMQTSGYAEDAARQAAVARAVDFVLESTKHALMDPDYQGGYDVRGWGHCYALWFLCRMERLELTPSERRKEVQAAIRWYLAALEQIEIPKNGGWSYSRANGKDEPSPPSAFMTAPCCQALFEAAALGFKVDPRVVERGLAALERGLVESGAVTYMIGSASGTDLVPGAVGRMLATETTLSLAGRSSPARVRAALDAFLVHWHWLDARRAKDRTHEPPYSVAPYYFYYAHYHAAVAIELLPEAERAEYRERLRELLYRNRRADGTWNDRVFERTANYGTSMSVMALAMPELAPPAGWSANVKGR